MPWTKPDAVESGHPAYAYHGRVGELSDSQGGRVGHVIVVAWAQWSRVEGRLWWKRWGRPAVTVDLQLVPANMSLNDSTQNDQLDEGLGGGDLDLALRSWASGELTFGGTTYRVAWLPREAGDALALDTWGWDLPAQRQIAAK